MFAQQDITTLVPLTMSSALAVFDQFAPDWRLAEPGEDDGDSPREYRSYVAFATPFANIPMVHAGISGFDIDNRDTARLRVRAEAISAEGFELCISTWRQTRVYQVEISWIALGHQATA